MNVVVIGGLLSADLWWCLVALVVGGIFYWRLLLFGGVW
jgi:hypothetical protein